MSKLDKINKRISIRTGDGKTTIGGILGHTYVPIGYYTYMYKGFSIIGNCLLNFYFSKYVFFKTNVRYYETNLG